MEKELLEKLKNDLAEAVKKNDWNRINEIKSILNVSEKQEEYFLKGLSGYPSVDKVWLKYYQEGAENLANNIPIDKTIWDVFEEKLIEYYDYPALEYFGRKFSKQEFIDSCYSWARTFRAMGVEENEVVPVYGPFVPDVCAMLFALNMIGACPYFLKLAISPEALAEETSEAKIAVVFDGMWKNVAHEFSKDKFKNVIIVSASDDMPSPKKQVVSFLGHIQSMKNKSSVPREKKYIWADKAHDIANYYSGQVKVPFQKDRSAIITSSSGTTIGGMVKGTTATNESVIAQIQSGYLTKTPFFPRDRVLNHFPPTASTSINSLFLLGLYNGSIIVVDPRVSEKDFYNQLVVLKPNVALSTGSAWEAFFNQVEKEMKQGKKFDFSYAKGWTIGGEGIDSKKFQHWNDLMEQNHAYNQLFSGYGLSETFSAVSVDNINATRDYSRPMVGVGIPQVAMVMGIFDENDKELTYNQRGELRIKTKAAMKEYYKKPELTAQTKVDGWIRTGDLAEIDEEGFLYVWGRKNDSIKIGEKEIYLFDIANKIKEKKYIYDALVLPKPTVENDYNLVAHIVWNKEVLDEDKAVYIDDLNESLKSFLPQEMELDAYYEHDTMIPYSPTTLKKDKNRLANETKGYFQVNNGELENIEYQKTLDGMYYKKVSCEKKQKKLVKEKRD